MYLLILFNPFQSSQPVSPNEGHFLDKSNIFLDSLDTTQSLSTN